MQSLYLHIGFHKTATSFMQRSIFPKLKQVNYIKTGQIKKELSKIRYRKKLSNLETENLMYYFKSFNNGKPMLMSFEGLSGTPLSAIKRKPQLGILKDLRRIFPESEFDVHIIFGIREQVALLTSLYVQFIHMGGVIEPEDFLKDRLVRNGAIDNFQYHQFIQEVYNLFGEDHTYIMIYEYFKENFSEEMLKILNYMGESKVPKYKNVSRNKSYGTSQLAIAKKLNRLFKNRANPNGIMPYFHIPKFGKVSPRRLLQNDLSFRLHYKQFELTEDLQNSLKNRYLEGNKILVDRYLPNLPIQYYK
ncbi:hypothetical protein GCM10009001_22650 [Virgibacillus siamensis]|uniref:Sulfotransferase domain-containing protein n=1 Tax=Virgibacillus siamensis TaxID=480071 RepID=A0ABN1G689_9BACI